MFRVDRTAPATRALISTGRFYSECRNLPRSARVVFSTGFTTPEARLKELRCRCFYVARGGQKKHIWIILWLSGERWSPFLIVTRILLLSFFVNLRTPRRSGNFLRLFRLCVRAVKGSHQDSNHPPGLKSTQITVTDTHCKFRNRSSEAVESHSFSFGLRKYGMLTIIRINKLTRLLFNPSLRSGLVILQTPLDLDLCVSYSILGSLDTRT